MKLTFLILVIFGVLVLAWEADSAECPIKCPNETKWQCGRERQPDGSWKYVTFKSLCYLIMTNTCLGVCSINQECLSLSRAMAQDQGDRKFSFWQDSSMFRTCVQDFL
ncbi:unnamed protein product [Nezara viridula]|uniref:Neuropeptide n=1 Tax=Nezara viridula TaxID=85310 RepID=A0A9P0GYZ4_NEZVI|nr:unnamed protein product [Nezara viridula]